MFHVTFVWTCSSAVAYALSYVKQSHNILKEKQLDTLQMLYEGHDVFLWVPTGYDKSICYQTLPFIFDMKLNRISSPLSEGSIMVDQVTSLHDRGVSAGILSGNKGVDKKFLASEKDVLEDKFRLLYSAPEAIIGNHHSVEAVVACSYTYSSFVYFVCLFSIFNDEFTMNFTDN